MTICGNAGEHIQQSRAVNLHRMITTLRLNIKDPYRRRAFGATFAGKLIGVGAVVGLIYGMAWFFSTKAGAAVPGAAAALKAVKETAEAAKEAVKEAKADAEAAIDVIVADSELGEPPAKKPKN